MKDDFTSEALKGTGTELTREHLQKMFDCELESRDDSPAIVFHPAGPRLAIIKADPLFKKCIR